MRYRRSPGESAKGSGTNASAVRSGPAEVAAGDTVAARAELAGDADRHRLAGAGRARSPRVPEIGRPRGTEAPAGSLLAGKTEVYEEFSVGP